MANSKFLKYQDTDDTGLIDACDDLANVPTDPACPPCQKNPGYIVPDWKTKDVDQPWLNERFCRFQITVVTDETSLLPNETYTSEESSAAHVEEIFNQYKATAAEGLLEYFGKDTSQVDTLAEALAHDKYELDFRPDSRVKLLYSADYDALANLLNSTEEDSDTTSDEEDEQQEEVKREKEIDRWVDR